MRTQSGNGKKPGKHQAELRLLVWQADREQKYGILEHLNINVALDDQGRVRRFLAVPWLQRTTAGG